MPKLNDLYPSKFLTAAELDEDGIIVTIRDITIEKMGDGMEKPCLHFDESDKGLILNKTNAKIIGKMYGDDTDNWEDERISLYPTYVSFKGDQVEAIRVKPKKPKPIMMGNQVIPGTDDTPVKSRKPAPVMTQDEVDDDDGHPPF